MCLARASRAKYTYNKHMITCKIRLQQTHGKTTIHPPKSPKNGIMTHFPIRCVRSNQWPRDGRNCRTSYINSHNELNRNLWFDTFSAVRGTVSVSVAVTIFRLHSQYLICSWSMPSRLHVVGKCRSPVC